MAGPDDRALNRTLGLFVEDTDGVTFGATFYGLATYREHNARHLVDEGHCFVALNQVRLHQLDDAKRTSGLQATACGEANGLFSLRDEITAYFCTWPSFHLYVRVLEHPTALDRSGHCCDFDCCNSTAKEPHRTSFTCACGNFEQRIEMSTARIEINMCNAWFALR